MRALVRARRIQVGRARSTNGARDRDRRRVSSPSANHRALREWRLSSSFVAVVSTVLSAACAALGWALHPGDERFAVSPAIELAVVAVTGGTGGMCATALVVIGRGARPRGTAVRAVIVTVCAQATVAAAWLLALAWVRSDEVASDGHELAAALGPAAWAWVPGSVAIIMVVTALAFRTRAGTGADTSHGCTPREISRC